MLMVWREGATGSAGTVTVTVRVAGDTDPGNDSATAEVGIGGHGADIRPDTVGVDHSLTDRGDRTAECIIADDCYKYATVEPPRPGGYGEFRLYIRNQGDTTAKGFQATVTLPDGMAFATDVFRTAQGDEQITCTLSNGRRTAVCVSAAIVNVLSHRVYQTTLLHTVVKVAPEVAGSVRLTGGQVDVMARDVDRGRFESAAVELNALDNDATFAVLVGPGTAAPSPDPSPSPSTGPSTGPSARPSGTATSQDGSGGAASGGGGDEPTLPITGPVAATTGGIGLAAVLVGGALLVGSRRRRPVVNGTRE